MSNHNIGTGATDALSLRVSAGVLVKVLFENPENKQTMLAFERTATQRVIDGKPQVIVKTKPFGGAIRIINPQAFKEIIGDFHYDSERSRQERDFRILVHPDSWKKIKEICMDVNESGKGLFDTGPDQELLEEFNDCLKIKITPEKYISKYKGIVIEDLPGETDNIYARDLPTVRIYYIFETRINSPEIIRLMLKSSKQYSDKDLQKIALEDASNGGRGRANAAFTINKNDLKEFYLSISINMRSGLIHFMEHLLDGNVAAVLEEIEQPKYKRYIK
jgi:hypothetical protein